MYHNPSSPGSVPGLSIDKTSKSLFAFTRAADDVDPPNIVPTTLNQFSFKNVPNLLHKLFWIWKPTWSITLSATFFATSPTNLSTCRALTYASNANRPADNVATEVVSPAVVENKAIN